METVYIGVGSNLGGRKDYIEKAIALLSQTPGIQVIKVSSLYETDPVGGPPQGKFLNGAIELETTLAPAELLACLKEIERKVGRRHRVRYGPREVDLDILLYGHQKIAERGLRVPHPKMRQREFVLIPLREIAPDWELA